MDIVTHTLIGSALAAPLAERHPLVAASLLLGSVLPDLDALSRLFGKRAFLAFHQTWTHSWLLLPWIAVLVWCAFQFAGLTIFDGWCALALFAGMALHSWLDVTNTYGIALFLPWSPKRFCLEWVFFIDATVILATSIVLAAIAWGAFWWGYFLVFLAAYWGLKAFFRRRAIALCRPFSFAADPLAMMPSALWPWVFLGCAREETTMHQFNVNVLTQTVVPIASLEIYDERYPALLQSLPDYQQMCRLSPAYHLVEIEANEQGTQLRCRDLRTRNFQTQFGALTIQLDAQQNLQHVDFHV